MLEKCKSWPWKTVRVEKPKIPSFLFGGKQVTVVGELLPADPEAAKGMTQSVYRLTNNGGNGGNVLKIDVHFPRNIQPSVRCIVDKTFLMNLCGSVACKLCKCKEVQDIANMTAFEVEEVEWVLTAQATARHETAEADISE